MQNSVVRVSVFFSDYQKQKMRILFEYLYENNEYFHMVFDSLKIDISAPVESIFEMLPVTDKNTIKENFDLYISKTNEKKLLEMTSGTTGVPLRCIKTESERAIAGRYLWKERLRWDAKVNSNNFVELMNRGYKTIGDFSIFEKENLQRCFNKVMSFSPRWICGPITVVEMCAKFIQKGDIDYEYGAIKFVELQGESVDADKVKYIEDVLGCRTVNHYGNRECWVIAYECTEHNLHIMDQLLYVEIINKGKYSFDKEMGEIVITSYYNKTMPIIRYNTGDIGKIENKMCECGRASQTLKLAGGRVNCLVKGKNGVLGDVFFKRVVQKAIKKDHKAIEKYRVEQLDFDHFLVSIKKGVNFSDDIVTDIINLTQKALGLHTRVDIRFTEDFPSLPSGKLSLFQVLF